MRPEGFLIFIVILFIIDALTNGAFLQSDLFLVVFLCSCVLSLFYVTFRKKLHSPDDSSKQTSTVLEDGRIVRFLIVVSLVLSIVMTSYRYLLFPRAYGPDVPDYLLYTSSWMRGNFLIDTFIAEHGLVVIILFLLRLFFEGVFNLSFDIPLMAFPTLLVMLYCLVVYRFVKVGTGNKFIAAIAACITPLTVFTIRLSYDLFGQLLGILFSLLFFSYYLESLKDKNRKALILSEVSLILVVVSHIFTYFFVIVGISIFLLSKISEGNMRDTIRVSAKIFLPSLIVMVMVLAYFTVGSLTFTAKLFPNLLDVVGSFRLFNPSTNWFSFSPMSLDSKLLWLLSILGVFALFKVRDNFMKILLALPVTVCFGLFVLGYQPSYRLLLYLPIMIFGALGFSFLSNLCIKLFAEKDIAIRLGLRQMKFNQATIQRLLTLFILLALIVAVFPQSIVNCWNIERPTGEAEAQLSWIAQQYGYMNGKVLILTQHSEDTQPNLRRWMRAISGSDIYGGNLIRLLNGQPDWFASGSTNSWAHEPMIPYYWSNLTRYSLIAMPSAFYSVGSLERSISQKIAGQDIYVFNVTANLFSTDFIQQYVVNNSLWTDDTFELGWNGLSPVSTMNQVFVTDGSSLTLQVENTGKADLVIYEKAVPQVQGKFFFLRVRGNMTAQVQGSIEIYYKDETSTGLVFPDYTNTTMLLDPHKYAWMYCELNQNKAVDNIRLLAKSYGDDIGTYFFQIDVLSVVG